MHPGFSFASAAIAALVAVGATGGSALAVEPAVRPAVATADASAFTRIVTVTDRRITESSGLVISPDNPHIAWTVNDSGDSARAFALSLTTGNTIAIVKERVAARDCEAMTAFRDSHGRSRLWIGDIGDNYHVRSSVVLRLLTEPAARHSETVTPISLRVRYPSGPHDAESLTWTPSGRLLIVTKTPTGGTIYQVPSSAVHRALSGHSVTTPVLAHKVGHVSQVLPDDAAALPDGRLIVRDYQGATIYLHPHYDNSPLVVQTRLTLPAQPQGETMAFADGGTSIVVGSEGVDQPLWRVPIPAEPATEALDRR